MKRALTQEQLDAEAAALLQEEEFSLDLGTPPPPTAAAPQAASSALSDSQFSLDLGTPPGERFSLDIPPPINTRGDVTDLGLRPVRETVQRDYGVIRDREYNEPMTYFSSETVITALLIWNRLVEQFGGFPVEILVQIFDKTIFIFHAIENSVFANLSNDRISITDLQEENFLSKTRFFYMNPYDIWQRGARYDITKNYRFGNSKVSDVISFPLFLTMVFDNIVQLFRSWAIYNNGLREWHSAVAKHVKNMATARRNNSAYYYVSSGKMVLDYNLNAGEFHTAIAKAPTTYFNLRRTNGTFETYQFNIYGQKARVMITAVFEKPQLNFRFLPGYSFISPPPTMAHIRKWCYPKFDNHSPSSHHPNIPRKLTFNWLDDTEGVEDPFFQEDYLESEENSE